MSAIDFRLFCPISRLPHNLRDLLQESRAGQAPIIVTQKGRPTAVVLTVEQYTALTNPKTNTDSVSIPS